MAGWRRRGGLIGGLVLLCVICFGLPWGAAVAAKDKPPAGQAAKAADVAHDAPSSAVASDRADQSRTSAAAKPGTTRKSARIEAAKKKKKVVKKDSAKKGDAVSDEDDEAPPAKLVERAMAVQDRNTDQLMSQKGIVGTATGVDEDGNVVIRVYTSGADNPQIPATLEGIPVEPVLSGPIHAWAPGPKPGAVQPTAKYSRPVPIGVSSMADTTLCAAATLGCRVKDLNHPANVYALSCNHVYALENQGVISVTPASQPSPLDINCQVIPENDFGKLTAFVPINFSGQNNVVDCAVVQTTTALVGNSTPSNGYGTPGSSPASALLRQSVQKYGRTTGQTKGTVVAINVTILVGYDFGTAVFVKQIEAIGASGSSALGKAGDSGSLVVDSLRRPVGLLFAGGGRYTFCNPIGDVLQQLSTQLSTAESQVSLAVDGN